MSLRPHKYLLLFTVSYLLTVSHCLVRVHVLNVLRRDEILVHYITIFQGLYSRCLLYMHCIPFKVLLQVGLTRSLETPHRSY